MILNLPHQPFHFTAFDEDDDLTSPTAPVESVSMLKVEWLLELPEDLDMCIAQRNFEEAADLIIKSEITNMKVHP